MRSLQESVGQLAEENSELKRKIESFQQPTALRGPSSSRLQVAILKLEQGKVTSQPITAGCICRFHVSVIICIQLTWVERTFWKHLLILNPAISHPSNSSLPLQAAALYAHSLHSNRFS